MSRVRIKWGTTQYHKLQQQKKILPGSITGIVCSLKWFFYLHKVRIWPLSSPRMILWWRKQGWYWCTPTNLLPCHYTSSCVCAECYCGWMSLWLVLPFAFSDKGKTDPGDLDVYQGEEIAQGRRVHAPELGVLVIRIQCRCFQRMEHPLKFIYQR